MCIPRIYADFNSIEYLKTDKSLARIGLTGYGTLASLSNQKLKLIEGMTVLLYEPEDIEVEGTVYFDNTKINPIGILGEWFVHIDARKIRECTQSEIEQGEHLCFGCSRSLVSYFKIVGKQYKESCPYCGTSIMAPLAPPENMP